MKNLKEGAQETKTILIVDYDKSTCRVFREILRKQGFAVDVAKDGEEAKKKMKNNSYDATLISFILPDMDGIDLLLFTTKTMPNAAKIMTTGFPSLKDGIRVIEAGADAYFSKPVEPEELVRVIAEKLETQENKPSNTTKSSGGSSVAYDGNGRKDLLNGLNGAC